MGDETDGGTSNTAFPTTQGIIDDLTRLLKPLTNEAESQTTDSFVKQITTIGDDCKVCNEGQLNQRVIWVGCSCKTTCSYWVHARCMGIAAKTNAPLSKIKLFCPKHIASAE